MGLSPAYVAVSSWIDMPDGGVDGSGTTPPGFVLPPGSFLKASRLCLQVKAGRGFRPWQEAEIRTELFGEGEVAPEDLKAGVRTCVEQGGEYVLVCTGVDLVDQHERDAERHVTAFLRRCGYPNPRVAVWGVSRLLGLIGQLPSVALALNGNGRGSFLIHSRWASQSEMRREFRAGPDQVATIESLRAELRRGRANGHMRIRGEAGIGKTRLVCEVTREPDLQPLVVYCDSPSRLVPSSLLSATSSRRQQPRGDP